MSIGQIRKSIVAAVVVGALGVAGLLAGRLSADAFPGRRGDFTSHVFGRVARVLDLTSDQKAQAKNILRAHATEIEAQMTAGRAAHQALQTAVMAQPLDESAIRARAADAGQVHADGAVLLAKIRAEIDPILTADQKDRLKNFQSMAKHRGDNAVQSFEKFLHTAS
jgi:Spy/CpxP family protein refolding chaperone